MGKSRRNNTAKTGDRGIYKQRQDDDDDAAVFASQKRRNDDDDDPMYNEVDRFHKDKDIDYLKFVDNDAGSDDDDESDENDVYQQEAVMDLGAGGRDEDGSDDDDDDDSSDEENEEEEKEQDSRKKAAGASPSASSSDDDDSSSDDDNNDDVEMMQNDINVRDWGKRKSAYYHGDTADLEIGQDADDALVEEEAAKEVQAARYKDMSERDFNLSDSEEQEQDDSIDEHVKKNKKLSSNSRHDKSHSSVVLASSSRLGASSSGNSSGGIGRLSKLSLQQQRKVLDRQHPEFLPILAHFSDVVRNFHQRTNVATRALLESNNNNIDSHDLQQARKSAAQTTAEAVGATKLGQQYLLSKALLESSTALNLAMYLLLKSEQQQEAAQQDEQLDGNSRNGDVVAATTLSASASSTMIQSHPIMDRLQKLNALASKLEEQVEDKVPGLQIQIDNLVKASQFMAKAAGEEDDDENEDVDVDSASSASDHVDTKERKEGKSSDTVQVQSDKRIASSKRDGSDYDQDDAISSSDDEAEEDKKAIAARNALNEARFSLRLGEVSGTTTATRSRQNRGLLQRGTLPFGDDDEEDDGGNNAGQHLAATLNALEQRRSTATYREKRRAESMVEYLDGPKDEDDYNKNYLHDDDDDNNEDDALQRGLDMMEADLTAKGADEDEDPDGDDNGGDDFYAQVQRKSRARKALKQEHYAVAPKFPRLEQEGEDGQQRAVSQSILKNRGLVPHKPKINRNPRVKKRKQFDKALIRRRGAIRDVRAPQEGHQYGGEQTGIKSNISRSRKL